jgi:hypothetical protein
MAVNDSEVLARAVFRTWKIGKLWLCVTSEGNSVSGGTKKRNSDLKWVVRRK